MKAEDKKGQFIAQAWRRWLAGNEGRLASDPKTLPSNEPRYLENRLWQAFMAGIKAEAGAAIAAHTQIEVLQSPIANRKSKMS